MCTLQTPKEKLTKLNKVNVHVRKCITPHKDCTLKQSVILLSFCFNFCFSHFVSITDYMNKTHISSIL